MTRIRTLTIRGYQQLTGAYEFGPGLTVVTGPNEAGKSALHEALTHAMFGFSSADRRSGGGRSPKDERRPWDGRAFGLVLALDDQHGVPLRIDWDFDADRVDAYDDATGAKLLSEHPKQREEWSVGPAFIGMPRGQHLQLCCLLQESLAAVVPDQSLQVSLQHAVEKAGVSERAVEQAVDVLKRRLSVLGIHAGHFSYTPSGRAARLAAAIEADDRALGEAQRRRDALEEIAGEQRATMKLLVVAKRQCDADRQAVLRAESVQRTETLEKARDLFNAAHDEADERSPAALPPDSEGRVRQARDQVDIARRSQRDTEAERLSTRDELEGARKAVRDADAVCDELSAYADVDPSNAMAVAEALAELRNATVPHAAVSDAQPYSTRQPSAPRGAGGARGPRSAALGWMIGGALALIGVGAGIAVHPAAFALVVVAVAITLAMRSRALDPLAETRATPQRASRPGAPESGAQSGERRQQALDQLAQLLSVPPDAELEFLARRYQADCDKHRDYLAALVAKNEAAERLRRASQPTSDDEHATRALTEAEATLRGLLREAGIDVSDLDRALIEYAELVERDRKRRKEADARSGNAGRLETLLAGGSIEGLAAAADDARAALAEHVNAWGELGGGGTGEGSIEGHRSELDALNERMAELGARREERESEASDPGELELRLNGARAELDLILRESDAIKIARETLREAATATHRRVAPHLNAALEVSLPAITRGHYTKAWVDEDLSISVQADSTDRPVEVDRLSRGTQDQVALIQRLALTRVLDPTGGSTPLLLDDCFAHTDAYRLPLALQLLAEQAAHRQVILFTDDEFVVDEAFKAAPDAALIALPDPLASVRSRPAAGVEGVR